MRTSRPKSSPRLIAICFLLISLLALPKSASAYSGTPDSTEFGYGARLDPFGDSVGLAIKAADSVGIDWIGVDLDWAQVWPDRDAEPQLEEIDFVMRKAIRYDLGTLVSITNPPPWVITTSGPDQAATTRFVLFLAERYPHNNLSFELLPGANTVQGWGAEPDPSAYSALLKSCWEALQSVGSRALLIAGGLNPASLNRSASDMDDLVFLSGLYRAGAVGYMPVVSLRLTSVTADILADPQDNSTAALRHYEAIRKIMTQNGHSSGLIWVTGFSCPVQELATDREQAEWITRSYQLMRSQLYIGTAFLDGLNPPSTNSASLRLYIIEKEGSQPRLHPVLASVGQVVTLDRTGQSIPNPLSGDSAVTGNK